MLSSRGRKFLIDPRILSLFHSIQNSKGRSDERQTGPCARSWMGSKCHESEHKKNHNIVYYVNVKIGHCARSWMGRKQGTARAASTKGPVGPPCTLHTFYPSMIWHKAQFDIHVKNYSMIFLCSLSWPERGIGV